MLKYQSFLTNLNFETQLINDVKKLIFNKALFIGKPEDICRKNFFVMSPENQDRHYVVVQIRDHKPIDKAHDYKLTKALSEANDDILVMYDHDHGDVKMVYLGATNLNLGFCLLMMLAYYSPTADEPLTDIRLFKVEAHKRHAGLHYSNQPTANLYDLDEVQAECEKRFGYTNPFDGE